METINKNLNELIELCANMSVLYVEDDISLRDVNTSILENLFDSIDTCSNGQEAIELYNKNLEINNCYDIVLTDINMPYINGIDLASQILKQNPNQQILVISAYNDSAKLEALIELGIKYYVQKPVSTEKLMNVLYKVVKEFDIKQKELLEKKELTSIDNITKLKNTTSLYEDIKKTNFNNILIIKLINYDKVQSIYGVDKTDVILNDLVNELKSKTQIKNNLYRSGIDKLVYLFSDDLHDTATQFVEKLDESIFNYAIGLSDHKIDLISSAKMALEYAITNNEKFKIYTKDIDTKKLDETEFQMQKVIAKAIVDDTVFPMFQPIYSKEGAVLKYEILMRISIIENNNETVFYPNEFIDIAIKNSKFFELNCLMLKKAFDIIKISEKKFSFNISYKDIQNSALCQFIEDEFKKDPNLSKRFIFELLETNEIDDYKILEKFIKRFKDYGVQIALDDFGSGYSNLNHVLNIESDYIKIDGSLIKEITFNNKSLAIVKSIVSFAKETNLKTIAEFVSSKEIFEKLKEVGIDEFQGFYLSKPLKEI
ncbi:MAG: EAL domain-containing response regulator [Campylobacterota bacterium]